MRRRTLIATILAVGTALAAPLAGAPAYAATPPVPAALGAPSAPADLGSLADPSPPGSNDWGCRPGHAHPEPVVLLHGLGADQAANWSYLAPQLAAEGYCVFSLTYGIQPPLAQVGGLAPMQSSARELAGFISRVRRATGAEQVDIVGHSEGSLMPNYYIKFLGGEKYVHRYVGMTPLWRGTTLQGLTRLKLGPTTEASEPSTGLVSTVATVGGPVCGSCAQFLHGSRFLDKMNSDGGPAVDGVVYTMIMTSHDEVVTPYTSGRMSGEHVTNIVLQDRCPTDVAEHLAVAIDPVNAQYVRNALDPDHARPVRCLPLGAPMPHTDQSS